MPKCPNCKEEIDTVNTGVIEWWEVELFIGKGSALEADYVEISHCEPSNVYRCILCNEILPLATETEVEGFLKGEEANEQ